MQLAKEWPVRNAKGSPGGRGLNRKVHWLCWAGGRRRGLRTSLEQLSLPRPGGLRACPSRSRPKAQARALKHVLNTRLSLRPRAASRAQTGHVTAGALSAFSRQVRSRGRNWPRLSSTVGKRRTSKVGLGIPPSSDPHCSALELGRPSRALGSPSSLGAPMTVCTGRCCRKWQTDC